MVNIFRDILSIFVNLLALTQMSPYHLPNTHLHSLPMHLLSSAFVPPCLVSGYIIVNRHTRRHAHICMYNINYDNTVDDFY